MLYLKLIIMLSILYYGQNLDLNFIYNQILENHPGIYNESDPEFKNNLVEEYLKANRSLMNADNLEQKKFILNHFVKSFNDNHLRINWKINPFKLDFVNTPRTEEDIEFKFKNINYNTAWIELPSFDIYKKHEYQFNLFLSKLSNLKDKDIIIFDLRHNQGGNSSYGTRIVEHLFGQECTTYKKQSFSNMYVDWRVSSENIKYLETLYKNHADKWILKVLYGMQESLKTNKNYYPEILYTSPSLKPSICEKLSQTTIVIIIDHNNFSAALDFIDELKIMSQHIYFIGEKTRADRLYMESKTVELPSGDGNFTLPIKVYRNRKRLDNAPYYPDIPYNPVYINADNILKILQENKIID